MKNGCVFAGSFDPVTKGHESIIKRCVERYGRVLVVIGQNKAKTCFFTEDERALFVKKAFENIPSVEVIKYSDYGADYPRFVKEQGYTVYVRGIRNEDDMRFEQKIEKENKILYPFFETVYMLADGEDALYSSTAVRQMIEQGNDVTPYLPKTAADVVNEAIRARKN